MIIDRAQLERECRSFTRLLSGRAPNDYLLGKYLRAHEQSVALHAAPGFDSRLVRAAAVSPVLARIADGYARHFLATGALRKKLVLALALVEVTPPYCTAVEGAPAGSVAASVARLVAAGAVGALAALAGLLIFGPVHLASRRAGARS